MKRGDVDPETRRLATELLQRERDAVLVFYDADPASDSQGPLLITNGMPAPQVIARLREAIRLLEQL